MAHGDAVVHGDGVEFCCEATVAFDALLDAASCVAQVAVSGYELSEGVYNGYDGAAHLLLGHAVGAPQGAGSGHAAAVDHGVAPRGYAIIVA